MTNEKSLAEKQHKYSYFIKSRKLVFVFLKN